MIYRIFIFLFLISGCFCACNFESAYANETSFGSNLSIIRANLLKKSLNDLPNEQVVYVTKTGKKYHRQGCHYLKSSIPMTIDNALIMGYDPCKVCRP